MQIQHHYVSNMPSEFPAYWAKYILLYANKCTLLLAVKKMNVTIASSNQHIDTLFINDRRHFFFFFCHRCSEANKAVTSCMVTAICHGT
jgi:hypothetical protein